MFALDPVAVVAVVVIAFFIEVVLFWAASALGDAPTLGWGKIFLVPLSATLACAGVGAAMAWSLQAVALLSPDNRLLLVVIGLLGLLVTWVIPGVLYAPLVPVSIPRGMFISVVQVLLRLFLYVLIAAVFMVVLALLQIWRGTDARSEVLVPGRARSRFGTAMILEGIVTTLGEDDTVNIAPMGPRLDPSGVLAVGTRFMLRPFKTARTHTNLGSRGEGVLHVSDDVLLLARAAVGPVEPLPPMRPATAVQGRILTDACRAYEFRIVAVDDREERATLMAEVVEWHRQRDFFGFNRAMHAVLEAAILATRTSFLPLAQIEAEYQRLEPLVTKTGGPREMEAFAFLQQYIQAKRS